MVQSVSTFPARFRVKLACPTMAPVWQSLKSSAHLAQILWPTALSLRRNIGAARLFQYVKFTGMLNDRSEGNNRGKSPNVMTGLPVE